MTKLLSVLLVIVIGLTAFTGCSTGDLKTKDATNAKTETAVDSSTTDIAVETNPQISKERITLTYWTQWIPSEASGIKSFADYKSYQELENMTNIHIESIFADAKTGNEQFMNMAAAGNLPDIIEGWVITVHYPGGAPKAASDGLVLKLNDYLENHMPDYKKVIDEYPFLKKQIFDDQGNIYSAATIRETDSPLMGGYIIRKDLLDKAGMETPTTIAEWETVLTKFSQMEIKYPWTGQSWTIGFFQGAFGSSSGYMVQDGKVVYGPTLYSYKEWLDVLSRWYKKNLIDKDFLEWSTSTQAPSKMLSGDAGAYFGYYLSGFRNPFKKWSEEGKNYQLVAVPHPVLKKGEKYPAYDVVYPIGAQLNTYITTKNKYPVETAKWLNLHYRTQISNLLAYGIEDVHYSMVNGYPMPMEAMIKMEEREAYLRTSGSMPGYYPINPNEKGQYEYPQQGQALEIWNKELRDSKFNLPTINLPPVTLTPEESDQLKQINDRVGVYMEDMFRKFVTGQEALSTFDLFVEQLKNMGVEDGCKIYQSALDRYNNR